MLVWGWALGSFLVARWLYAHFPVGFTGGAQVDAGGKRINVVKDEHGVDGKVNDAN